MSSKKPSHRLIEEAKKNPNGWVYQMDFDYKSGENIPTEAIQGAWKVNSHGEIEGEFEPNDNYRPIEVSRRILPKFMKTPLPNNVGSWIVDFDLRCMHLFPDIPDEAYVGYWLIGDNGILTDKFRPSSKYDPESVGLLLKSNNSK